MRSAGLRVFGSILVLAIAALACAAPSVDSLLNPLPKDDFSSNSSGWGTGTDMQSSIEYKDGGLKMVVYQPFYVTWSSASTKTFENIHIETSVANTSTDSNAMVGIVCNEEGKTSNFYYVGVTSSGYYAFIKSSVVGDDVYLKEGTSDVISASSKSMRLGLDCGNGTLTLYVNGQQIDTTSDSSYTNGTVGLFAATDSVEGGATVVFDDFVVTKLSQ